MAKERERKNYPIRCFVQNLWKGWSSSSRLLYIGLFDALYLFVPCILAIEIITSHIYHILIPYVVSLDSIYWVNLHFPWYENYCLPNVNFSTCLYFFKKLWFSIFRTDLVLSFSRRSNRVFWLSNRIFQDRFIHILALYNGYEFVFYSSNVWPLFEFVTPESINISKNASNSTTPKAGQLHSMKYMCFVAR